MLTLSGIFPNEGAIIRLIGAVLLEANDEWQLQHRYMQIDGLKFTARDRRRAHTDFHRGRMIHSHLSYTQFPPPPSHARLTLVDMSAFSDLV